jgi:predicted nucleic acid-binding protein
MPSLIDTNILLRSLHPEHPHHRIAEHAVETLRRRDMLCLAPQKPD